MPAKPLKIAVAGADGRVGSAVVREALAQGHTVVGLDATREDLVKPRERYSYKKVDTTDFEAYKEAIKGCDALVHLAATMNKVKDVEGNRTRPTADHEIHNGSVAMSFNALSAAEHLGIDRVVLASSVNSIGMLYSKSPQFDYLPLDEKHPHRPEEPYSLCKYIVEIQADAFARRLPSMRIATMRFHWIVPEAQVDITHLDQHSSSWKDLWGFTPVTSAAQACLNALTVPESRFPPGHETFWIVADTTQKQSDSYELLHSSPLSSVTDLRADFRGSNRGFYDTSKAERLLGWKEVGFPWKG